MIDYGKTLTRNFNTFRGDRVVYQGTNTIVIEHVDASSREVYIVYFRESYHHSTRSKLDAIADAELMDKTHAINQAPNIILIDVPTLMRLFEWCREDAKEDVDLHILTERLIKVEGTITMKNYEELTK